MAKHMIMLRDSITEEIIQFLEHCEGRSKDGGGGLVPCPLLLLESFRLPLPLIGTHPIG